MSHTIPTQADQYHRLQLFIYCIGDKAYSLSKKLRISDDCCCDIENLEVLTMYWSALECYDPDSDDNCLTQAQIDDIWNDITKRCGICFAPYGSTYTIGSRGSRLVTGGGDVIVDESGNNFIV